MVNTGIGTKQAMLVSADPKEYKSGFVETLPKSLQPQGNLAITLDTDLDTCISDISLASLKEVSRDLINVAGTGKYDTAKSMTTGQQSITTYSVCASLSLTMTCSLDRNTSLC